MAALLHQRGDSRSLGVDLQSVESRPYSWRKASFHSSELKELDGLPQSKHKEALTLWWSLKEAAAKCASHRGLTEGLGAPKEWLIEQWSNAQGINLNTQPVGPFSRTSGSQSPLFFPALHHRLVDL